MSEVIKQLNNIRSLRAQARDLPIEVLDDLLEKLTIVVEERREEESSRLANENNRREKLEALRLMMLEAGIAPSELLSVSGSSTKKPREPRPAKYAFEDENGERKTWTGQGRTPKRIADLIAQGATLEDFEIQ